MTAEPLSDLDRSTLRERALEALRSAITSVEYKPGDHLSEVALAGHLGVSRGTVREALRHLQQEGLVTAENRNMLRVSTVSPKEVRGLFRVRAALEGLAVAEIIALPERAAAVATLRTAPSRSPPTATATSRRSWRPISASTCCCARCRGTRCSSRPGATSRAGSGVTIMNCETDNAPSMMARKRHAPIVEAIERGDVADAKSVVEQHMAAAAQQYAPEDS